MSIVTVHGPYTFGSTRVVVSPSRPRVAAWRTATEDSSNGLISPSRSRNPGQPCG